MAIEGELRVRIITEGGRVKRAEARAKRPRVAARLFTGRPAREAPALAGALFAICGRSQAIAAAAAVEAAECGEAPVSLRAAREARIAGETLQEHAWRFLVDWPGLVGRKPEVQVLAAAREAIAPLLAAEAGGELREAVKGAREWAANGVFGREPAAFLALSSVVEFLAWTRETGTPVASLVAPLITDAATVGASDVAFLARGETKWVVRDLGPAIACDSGFDDVPHWRGEPRETGPLARMAAHPLVESAIAAWGCGVGARLVARLVEMAQVLEDLARGDCARYGSAPSGCGTGLAWVETARGLLVHSVAVDGGDIAAYRIVAPTEWNFHPGGAFARGAVRLDAGDAQSLERQVRLLVASLDPCVGVRYEAVHA